MNALAQIFRHPLRPLILSLIDQRGEASPADVAVALGASLGDVSYHTKVLHELGWLALARTERRRGGLRHVYTVATRPFIDDDEWERLPRAVRRRLARQTLSEIFSGAATALRAGGFDDAGAHIDRLSLRLDAQGGRELSALLTSTLDGAQAILHRSEARGAGPRSESVLAILHHGARSHGASDAAG